jgi:hypothetical protein
MNKQALTPIPLTPEENYEASQVFGRSLFSALQLAKEQEFRRNLEARKAYNTEDEKVLRIPIPENLMPQKMAAAQSTYSIIEHPDGSLEHAKSTSREAHTGEGFKRNVGRNTGLIAGSFGGPASALTGGMLGSILDAGPAHGGMKYSKTVERLDGRKEHIFEMEKNPGVGEHLKRNAGKYVGSAAGMMLGKAVPGKLKAVLLPLAGLSAGHAFDKHTKEKDQENLMSSEDTKADMLTDLDFHKRIGKDKKAESLDAVPPGVFQRALGSIANHPVRMLVGGQEGFRDAKKDFYYKQREQIQKELMGAQKEYIDLLSRIKTGSAESETPCVDAFCSGVAHDTLFGKTASRKEDVSIESGSIARLADAAASKAMSPFTPAVDYAASGLLGTSAGSAYLTYLLRKKMRERPDEYMEGQLPTRVELQPYH